MARKRTSPSNPKTDNDRLRAHVDAVLQHAEDVDASEHALYGDDDRELGRRELRARMARVRENLRKQVAAARAARRRDEADALRRLADDPTRVPPRLDERRRVTKPRPEQPGLFDHLDPAPSAPRGRTRCSKP